MYFYQHSSTCFGAYCAIFSEKFIVCWKLFLLFWLQIIIIIIIILINLSWSLGPLLTRSGLMYPEVSSKVCHDSFCQLGNNVSLPWVIYYEAFYLHVVSNFACIPVVLSKICFFFKLLCSLCICFVICPSVSCCSSHVFHLCCCYSSGAPCFNSPSFAAI